jgi:hypothetical protein
MKHPEIRHDLPDPEDPDRRAFTVASVLAVLGGVTITITGCGGDSPTAPSPPPGSVSGLVTANHGHAAFITAAELMANDAVSLQIRGGATHPHTVELSAQEVSQIGAGQRVSKTSTTDPSPDAGLHNHVVTFN